MKITLLVEILFYCFLLTGSFILLMSILFLRKFIVKLKGTTAYNHWRYLLFLTVFFLASYLAIIPLAATKNIEILYIVLSLLLLLGSVFVYIISNIGSSTIKEFSRTSDAVANANINMANLYLEKNIELEKANKSLDHLNKELIEKVKLFHRFVPSQFLEAIIPGAKEDHIELGVNAERDIAIMFIDIRSFTVMSSKLTAEETFEFINEFIRGKAPIISKHSGFIDKFMGDGIMAIFTNCNQALQAGIEI